MWCNRKTIVIALFVVDCLLPFDPSQHLPINMASNKNSIESPIPAGGNVSAGKKDMEVTGDIDLDRARDHVLHGTMHGRGRQGLFRRKGQRERQAWRRRRVRRQQGDEAYRQS
jgi:hypothetical protein